MGGHSSHSFHIPGLRVNVYENRHCAYPVNGRINIRIGGGGGYCGGGPNGWLGGFRTGGGSRSDTQENDNSRWNHDDELEGIIGDLERHPGPANTKLRDICQGALRLENKDQYDKAYQMIRAITHSDAGHIFGRPAIHSPEGYNALVNGLAATKFNVQEMEAFDGNWRKHGGRTDGALVDNMPQNSDVQGLFPAPAADKKANPGEQPAGTENNAPAVTVNDSVVTTKDEAQRKLLAESGVVLDGVSNDNKENSFITHVTDYLKTQGVPDDKLQAIRTNLSAHATFGLNTGDSAALVTVLNQNMTGDKNGAQLSEDQKGKILAELTEVTSRIGQRPTGPFTPQSVASAKAIIEQASSRSA